MFFLTAKHAKYDLNILQLENLIPFLRTYTEYLKKLKEQLNNRTNEFRIVN
jgi:hypothetical protein